MSTQAAEDSLEVSSPGGWKAAVKGREVILFVALLAACGLLWAHHAATHEDHANVSARLERIEKAIDSNTFVLTLKQDEREKLDLAMPDELRAKRRKRRDE